MSIPTEAERLAKYKADMAATVAAQGKPTVTSGPKVPGSGAIQTVDSARQTYRVAQEKAANPANKLTPAEQIDADYWGRTHARSNAKLRGVTLSDFELQQAGRKGIADAAERK
jgi:hypothetical protein